MAYCKKFLILFLILFILINTFWCVKGLCFEVETVEYTIVDNLAASVTQNYFNSSTASRVIYFEVEKGYIYHINNNYSSTYMNVVLPSALPSVNVSYDYLSTVSPNNSYDYLATENGILVATNIAKSVESFTITRERVEGQNSAISDLVENVGPNAFWGVFGSGLDFVFIIVIVAFGLFIIYKLIKGFSKGKSKI